MNVTQSGTKRNGLGTWGGRWLVCVALLLFARLGAQAAEVTIAWDPPTRCSDGSDLTDLAGYRVYSGVASRTYDACEDVGVGTSVTVSNLRAGVAHYFTVTCYSGGGVESIYSDEVTWVTNELAPPVVSSGPAGVSVTEPASAAFSVTVSGDGPLTYQWRRYGVPIGGSTSPSYEIAATDASADDGAEFDVVVSNPYGIVTSQVAVLTVYAAVDGRRPRLSWEAIESATAYEVWICRDGATYHTEWLEQTNTSWAADFDLEGGEYTWWVRAWVPGTGLGSWVGPERFAIEAVIPGAVTLLAPQDVVNTGRPTLTWQADAAATWYQMWLDKDGTRQVSAWLSGEACYAVATNLPYGNYQWWVRGWSPDGYGEWSEPMSFTYGQCTPLGPDGQVSGTRQPEFSWTAVDGAASYRIVISRGAATYLAETVADGTSWTPSSGLPSGSYDWSVQAWNSDGYGPTSSVQFAVSSLTSVTVHIDPPSTTIFSQGGSVGPFTSSISTTYAKQRSVKVEAVVRDPDGVTGQQLVNHFSLAANGTNHAKGGEDVYFSVPDTAPLGTTWHLVYVYDGTTGNLLDFNGFPFDVR